MVLHHVWNSSPVKELEGRGCRAARSIAPGRRSPRREDIALSALAQAPVVGRRSIDVQQRIRKWPVEGKSGVPKLELDWQEKLANVPPWISLLAPSACHLTFTFRNLLHGRNMPFRKSLPWITVSEPLLSTRRFSRYSISQPLVNPLPVLNTSRICLFVRFSLSLSVPILPENMEETPCRRQLIVGNRLTFHLVGVK